MSVDQFFGTILRPVVRLRTRLIPLFVLLLFAPGFHSAMAQELPPLPDSLLRNEIRLLAARGFYSVSTDIPLPSDTATGAACGSFSSGSGGGFAVSLELDHDLRRNAGISLGASVFTWETTVSFPCLEEADIRLPDGTATRAETEFVRRSDGLGIAVGLGGYLRVAEVVRLSAGISFNRLLSSENRYAEEVSDPAGAVFEDGRGERTISGISEPSELQVFDLQIGAEYRLRAGRRLWLLPHVRAWIPMYSSGESGSSITRFVVGLGAGYRFDLLGRNRSSPLEPGAQ